METKDLIRFWISDGAKYQIKYIDDSDSISVPVSLTEKRAEQLMDHSIKEIRIIF